MKNIITLDPKYLKSDDDSGTPIDWMEEEQPPVRQSAKSERKHRKRGEVSFHRDRKTASHTTVNGQGLIAQLRRKK